MLRTNQKLTQAAVLAVVLCMTGCASMSSAWDSTTSSISDFFKSDKSEKADKSEKPAEDKK
jgi:hypothetical protein